MKYSIIPLALLACLFFTNAASAQGKKGKAATAPAATAAPAATPEPAAGPFNMKDIEGKWKVDHVDVDTHPTEGEASKSTEAGADDDFFDFAKGTLTSYLTGVSLSVPYNYAGHNVVYKQDGMNDTLHVATLSKTKAVITKRDVSDDGTTNTVITLKR